MEKRLNKVAFCGIYCGACPGNLGRIRESAKTLGNWLDGWNYDDVASSVLPPGMNYPAFREVLSSLSAQQPCEGCREQGNPVCPIKTCAKGKGVSTCADCDLFVGSMEKSCENEEANVLFQMISIRYSGWNLDNLKRIREVGIEKFIDEADTKVENGFTTCEVISKQKVFSR